MMKRLIYFFILFIIIGSVTLVKFTYVSLLLSILSFILGLIFFRKKIRFLLLIIIISVATVITNIVILYKLQLDRIDIFANENVLLGTLSYNDGSYVFKDDYTYTEYFDSVSFYNYCVGSYKYSYGGMGNNNIVIYQDNSYYYYTLFLDKEYCVIDEVKIYENNYKKLVFGINKDNYNNLVFIDKDNNYAYQVTKVIGEN